MPRYRHDCDDCIFLGEFKKYDLYFCTNEPTVIARYGEDGDYISGKDWDNIEPLEVAKCRAIEEGLL